MKDRVTAKELREFMNFHGISIIELSEILGVTPQGVKLWLTGNRQLSITTSKVILLFTKYPRLIKEF